MSLKSFSFGLGLGLAFVSILFLVLLRVEVNKVKAEKQSVSAEMSDEDIINRAKELGMVFYTELPSKKDVLEVSSTSEEVELTEEISQISTEAVESENSLLSEEAEILINFSVSSGSTAGKISSDLQEKGLIDDAEDFKRYLIEKGYSTRILTGEFEIPQGADYDEIIDIIKDRKSS